MKTKSIPTTVLSIGVSSIVALASTSTGAATIGTILDEDFDNGTPGTWYRTAATSAMSVEVANNGGINATEPKALKLTSISPTGTFLSTVRTLPSVTTLAQSGDYIDLKFRIRLESTLDSGQSVRFGLYDSKGTAATDSATSTDNDAGYFATLSTNPANVQHSGRREVGGVTRILSGSDTATVSGTVTSRPGLADTQAHELSMRLTRELSGLRIRWTMDNVEYVNIVEATESVATYKYDEIALVLSQAQRAAFFDDFVVTTNVPEPAVAGLAGLSLAAATLTRRRRSASR